MSRNLWPLANMTVAGEPLTIDYGFFDDFTEVGQGTTVASKFGTTADTASWLVTLVNSANVVSLDAAAAGAHGGVIRAGVTGTTADKVSAQLNGSAFLTQANTTKSIRFETRLRTSAIAGTSLFVGLSAASTAAIATAPSDFVAFRVPAVGGAINSVSRSATGTEVSTSTGVSLVNDTWIVLGFEIIGTSRIDFYINGARVTQHVTQIPLGTVGLSPIFEGRALASTAFNLDIDYILAAAQR